MNTEEAINVQTDAMAENLFRKALAKTRREARTPEEEEAIRRHVATLVKNRLSTFVADPSITIQATEVLQALEEGQILFGVKTILETDDLIHVRKNVVRMAQKHGDVEQAASFSMVALVLREDVDEQMIRAILTPGKVRELYAFHKDTPHDATRFTTTLLSRINLKEPGLGAFPKLDTKPL
ncbi:hypothetical protein HY411_01065 [Candidatus Gottesmanbacteria bacterium]|nr:hypothetical protein [Candidatus Gottesmanbacteria bacterium]